MNCTTAQLEVQRRLDAAGVDAKRGFADLDNHLADCPTCARAWLQLVTARQQLAAVRADAPVPEEINAMWQTIDAAVPLELPAFRPPSRATILRFLSATAAVAACLFIAFLLGEQRYGEYGRAASVGASIQALRADTERVVSSDDKRLPQFTPRADLLSDSRGARTSSEAPVADASAAQSVTRNMWSLVQESDITPKQYFSHSTGPTDGEYAYSKDYHEAETAKRVSTETIEGVALGNDFRADRSERLGEDRVPPGLSDEDVQRLASLGFVGGDSHDPRDLERLQEANEPNLQGADVHVPIAGNSLIIKADEQDVRKLNDLVAQLDGRQDAARAAPQTILPALHEKLDDKSASQVWYDRGSDSYSDEAAEAFTFDRSGFTEDLDVVFLTSRPNRLDRDQGGALLADASSDQAQPEDPKPDVAQPVQPAGAPASAPTAATVRPSSTKLIKTGTLATEVDDFESAVTEVNTILTRFDCFLADAATKEAAGGALVGDMDIRVSPADFEPLFAALRQVGRLESEDVKSADVTAQYVDIEARIAASRITEERLVELIKSKSFVDRMDDLLKVEQEMNRVRTEIEQLQGQLRVLADRVALSTITMQLREPGRVVPSASISVEVPTLDAAADALSEALTALDGRLVSGKINQRDRGALAGEYRIKVNLNRFGEALAAIAALGRVESRDVRDWQEQSASAKWAARVPCEIALLLFERPRDLPAGSITLQIADVAETLAKLEEMLPTEGAAIASNHTTQRDDGSSSAEVQLRVPAGAFAALVAQVEILGRITAKQLTGEAGAIAGGAADTPCTLSLTLAEPVRQIPSGGMVIEVEKFAAARDRLADLISKHGIQVLDSNSSQRTDGTWVGRFNLGIVAGAIDTAVADLETLGKVSSREIRGIGLGQLSRIDKNALGVVEVILAEKSALAPEPDRAGDSFRRYLRDGLAGLYQSLGLIAYGLVVMAPWLVIALLAGWLITRAWKRRRAPTRVS